MKRAFGILMLSLYAGSLLATTPRLEAQSDAKNVKEEDRLYNSALVTKEAMGMKSRIPQKLLDKAECVIVIPSVIKGAVGFGGSYGRGAMSCRGGEDFNGPWSYPTMMALEGFSAGFQVGGQATDFVLLVMDERGARAILSGKFKIGGDAAAAAGPVGRDSQANLDVYLRTTILSYSRSRGLFAGVSLEGSTLRPDKRANEKLYGKPLSAKSIVLENAVAPPAPASAEKLVATLNKYGKNTSEPSASAAAIPPSAPSTAEPVSTPAPAPSSASAAAAAPPAPANRPPTASCSADPAPIVSGSGNTVLVRAEASDPDNDPLTYTWTTTAGTIDGSGPEVHWNPAGVAPGAYSVTAHVDDGRGGTVECQAALRVEAPQPAVEAKLVIHSVFFPTALPNTKQPNKGLMESQQETLTLLANDFNEYRKSQPDAHLVLAGHADHRGRQALNEGLSERRVEITKRFLIGLGIPEANLETKARGEEENITQDQVKQLVVQNPNLTPEQKHKILSQLRIVTLAQNRRVDITLSSTGQQSVRHFPFNAEDALTLLSPKRARSKS